MGLKDRFKNIKNIGNNFNIIKNNPYLYQKFMYNVYKIFVIVIGIIVAWQLITAAIHISSGNNSMTILTRAVIVLVGVIFIAKLMGFLRQMKQNLLHYEAHPTNIDNYLNDNKIDSMKEIDDILEKYGSKKMKGGKN